MTFQPMPQRIKALREGMGLSASELAGRAGVSPSYISVIESGSRVPSEEVAVRIAEVLDDDEELYRAWANARDVVDLDAHVDRLERLSRLSSDPMLRRRLARGDDLEQRLKSWIQPMSLRAQRMFRRDQDDSDDALGITMAMEEARAYGGPVTDLIGPDRSGSVLVPLLEEGADPGDDPRESAQFIELVTVDVSCLPPDVKQPFAYRVGEETVRRVTQFIRAGDLVVFSSHPGPLDGEHVHAIRHEEGIVLSRAELKGNALVLLPGGEGSSVELIDVGDGRAHDLIAGTVAATVRTWRPAQRSFKQRMNDRIASYLTAASRRAAPRKRGRPTTARMEGTYLVRDCEWNPVYGWRPIQRAEDLDYLDENPGAKIRFRLLKDGKPKYHLEMEPGQWRKALAGYADGAKWRTNGYIVAITKRKKGEYTEQFQKRWKPYVRPATLK